MFTGAPVRVQQFGPSPHLADSSTSGIPGGPRACANVGQLLYRHRVRDLVRAAPLVLQVTERFRELIRRGEWAVGARIPGEHHLAGELGVSRGTVREALRALSTTGLLEPRIGDGTYVRATDEITGVLVRDEVADGRTVVLDARAGLEAAAARLAARRAAARGTAAGRGKAGTDAVAALEDALAARAAAHAARDRAGYVAADAAFHRGVVVASGNPLLLRL